MEKLTNNLTAIYIYILGAISTFITFVAPGAETQFETFLLVLALWLFTAALRKVSNKTANEEFKIHPIIMILAMFAAIKFAAEASSIMLGMENSAGAQFLTVGFIAYISVKFIANLGALGVPIPGVFLDTIMKLVPENNPERETIEKMNEVYGKIKDKGEDKL